MKKSFSVTIKKKKKKSVTYNSLYSQKLNFDLKNLFSSKTKTPLDSVFPGRPLDKYIFYLMNKKYFFPKFRFVSFFRPLYNSEQNLSYCTAEELQRLSLLTMTPHLFLEVSDERTQTKMIAYQHNQNKITYQKTPPKSHFTDRKKLTAFQRKKRKADASLSEFFLLLAGQKLKLRNFGRKKDSLQTGEIFPCQNSPFFCIQTLNVSLLCFHTQKYAFMDIGECQQIFNHPHLSITDTPGRTAETAFVTSF